jgi:hypothetical protein
MGTANHSNGGVEDDPEDEQLNPNLFWSLNGSFRSVKQNKDLVDLNNNWDPEVPLPDLLTTVATQLMKCPLYMKSLWTIPYKNSVFQSSQTCLQSRNQGNLFD